jgi:hypothetical protein
MTDDRVNPMIRKNFVELESDGFTVVNGIFSADQIVAVKEEYLRVKARADDIMQKTPSKVRVWSENNVETRSMYWKTDKEVILQAGKGRYDLWRGFNTGVFSEGFMSRNPTLTSIMDRILVSDYSSYAGMIHALKGSESQYWHRDTDTLANKGTDGSNLILNDDFYFTCLIPITVPLTLLNGATEFMVGSHRRESSTFDLLERKRAEVPLGSALLFNGKINHRGMENLGEEDRPVLYRVYHKLWYNDQFRKGVELD